MGGARNQTYENFVQAVQNPDPARMPRLLIDSEVAVRTGQSKWAFLRKFDQWPTPQHLTVSLMLLFI